MGRANTPQSKKLTLSKTTTYRTSLCIFIGDRVNKTEVEVPRSTGGWLKHTMSKNNISTYGSLNTTVSVKQLLFTSGFLIQSPVQIARFHWVDLSEPPVKIYFQWRFLKPASPVYFHWRAITEIGSINLCILSTQNSFLLVNNVNLIYIFFL